MIDFVLIRLVMIGLILWSSLIYSNPLKPHVHGQATAEAILADGEFTIEITIPSDTVVGFEYAPQTDLEQKRVDKASTDFKRTPLFDFFHESRFLKRLTKVNPPSVIKDVDFVWDKSESNESDHDHGHNHHDDHPHDHDYSSDNQGSHAECHIKLRTVIDPSVTHIKTNLFSLLPDLTDLTVVLVRDERQESFHLTPKDAAFDI
tara:strand:- start:791 stop:1402 length:612 start_codon:yes stop_codon:yes gene_type:complete